MGAGPGEWVKMVVPLVAAAQGGRLPFDGARRDLPKARRSENAHVRNHGRRKKKLA
jgi:hypothetical protein